MTFNFKEALTPLIKGSVDIDQRYSSSVNKAIELAGKETIDGLLAFYKETSESESRYGAHAYNLVRCVLESAEDWQMSTYKKQLNHMLLELGFKKSKASTLIGAAEYADQLKRNKSEALPWVESLPFTSQYRLSNVSDRAFGVLWTETSEFGTKPVTFSVIREVGNKYPHTPRELGMKDRFVIDRPTTTTTTTPQPKPFTVDAVDHVDGENNDYSGADVQTTNDIVTHNTRVTDQSATIDITASAEAIEVEADKPSPKVNMSAVDFVDFVEDYIKSNKTTWTDKEVISVAIAGNLLLKAVGRTV